MIRFNFDSNLAEISAEFSAKFEPNLISFNFDSNLADFLAEMKLHNEVAT